MEGRIKGKAPQLGTLAQRLAQRVANINFPTTANSIFSALKQQQMGGTQYNDPRNDFQKLNSLGPTMREPDSTSVMKTKIINTLKLPNLGSQEDTGASKPGLKSGNSKYVDDQNFGVNLAQILGSRMLSQEQLQKASIQNVRQMFKVNGAASQDEAEEMYFMFQRMMLEGFIRGVDITKDIAKQGGFSVNLVDKVTNASNEHVIGKNRGKLGIELKKSFWRGHDDAAKMSLFYHEVGHGLLNKEHESSGMMKSGGNSGSAKTIKSTKDAYNSYMNDLFDSSGSGGFSHLKTPIVRNSDAKYDPSWFPAATGVDAGYSPTAGGEGGVEQRTVETSISQDANNRGHLNRTNGAPQSTGPSEDMMPVTGGSNDAPDTSGFANAAAGVGQGVSAPALQGFGNVTRRGA